MTAQRCKCGHYRFDHIKSAHRCDWCGCTSYRKPFRSLMREMREEKQWSQKRLAEVLLQGAGIKLDPSAITRIELGERDVKLQEAVAIAGVLGFRLPTDCDQPDRPPCRMCHGAGQVLVAPVTASYADWGAATKMPCPRCSNG